MIVSTTAVIEGKVITEYLGIVNAEVIVGIQVFKDVFAAFRDVVGGRARTYERELRSARETAMVELQWAAAALNADAVIGIQYDVEVVGRTGSMLLVSVNGTAVRFGKA